MDQRYTMRRLDGMEFSVQTCVDREGRTVHYNVHTGPNRAQRRDERFRPAMVAHNARVALDRASRR